MRRCLVGQMYADIRPKSDLWLLRHESTFSSLTINGAPITPHFSSGNTTQIHAQTFEQRSRGISGPQVSLSEGMPGWMPTGCSCQVDVVGVPTTQTMQNLQYMGRIRLPNLEFVGNSNILAGRCVGNFGLLQVEQSSSIIGQIGSSTSSWIQIPVNRTMPKLLRGFQTTLATTQKLGFLCMVNGSLEIPK